VAQASSAGSISDTKAKNLLIKKEKRESAKAAVELADENDEEIAMHESAIQTHKRELENIDKQIESLKKRRENVARDLKRTEDVLMQSFQYYEASVIKGHNETTDELNSIIHPDTD